MDSTFSLFIMTLVFFGPRVLGPMTLVFYTTYLVPAASASVGSAHMFPATISDEVPPVNPRNVMTEDFRPPADYQGYKSTENPATSGAPSAGEVGIPAILPEVNASRPNRDLIETKAAASISPPSPCDNKLCKLPMIYKAEGSEPPKHPAIPDAPSAGLVFPPYRRQMISSVKPISPESPGYATSHLSAGPCVVHSSPSLILFLFFLLIVHYY